jgi:hypothetical protein
MALSLIGEGLKTSVGFQEKPFLAASSASQKYP